MSNKADSRLPSPMEFPDVIQPVTPKDYPALWETFSLTGRKRSTAEIKYERLSAQIAILTGHEHAVDSRGYPYSRKEWKESLHKSLSLLNNELKLGMDRQMVDVLTLCYTALQESPRYGGDPVIEAKKGENTAVHSLHTMLQAFRVYQKTLEQKPDLKNNIEFFKSFQMTCLIMAVHDLGEMFGEAGSLAQVANTGNWGVKDKTAYERMVFNYGVRLAVQTVIDKEGTDRDFFDKIDRVKSAMKVQNEGINKTDQQMATEVSQFLTEKIPLSVRAQKLFGFLQDSWEWIEDPKHSRNPFLGYLSAICERVQGTRHINRMMTTSKSPHVRDDDRIEMITTHSLTPGYRMIVNSDYSEGHLGWMCNAIDEQSPYEKAVARQALSWVYETVMDFYNEGPTAFFMDGAVKEQKLHSDGSAFSPTEVRLRLEQIDTARKIACLEQQEVKKSLTDSFTDACIPVGRIAIMKKDVVAMYQAAINTGYMPKIVQGEKASRGEVLIRDLPAELTRAPDARELKYSKDTQKKIETLTVGLK